MTNACRQLLPGFFLMTTGLIVSGERPRAFAYCLASRTASSHMPGTNAPVFASTMSMSSTPCWMTRSPSSSVPASRSRSTLKPSSRRPFRRSSSHCAPRLLFVTGLAMPPPPSVPQRRKAALAGRLDDPVGSCPLAELHARQIRLERDRVLRRRVLPAAAVLDDRDVEAPRLGVAADGERQLGLLAHSVLHLVPRRRARRGRLGIPPLVSGVMQDDHRGARRAGQLGEVLHRFHLRCVLGLCALDILQVVEDEQLRVRVVQLHVRRHVLLDALPRDRVAEREGDGALLQSLLVLLRTFAAITRT